MSENIYRITAIEVFLDNVKNKIPDITPNELQKLKYAFETGYNMGVADNSPELIKEVALLMLSK